MADEGTPERLLALMPFVGSLIDIARRVRDAGSLTKFVLSVVLGLIVNGVMTLGKFAVGATALPFEVLSSTYDSVFGQIGTSGGQAASAILGTRSDPGAVWTFILAVEEASVSLGLFAPVFVITVWLVVFVAIFAFVRWLVELIINVDLRELIP